MSAKYISIKSWDGRQVDSGIMMWQFRQLARKYIFDVIILYYLDLNVMMQ